MKRTAIAIAVSALCASIAGGALAQEQQEQQFVDADSNGDGFLSQEEAQEMSGFDQDAFDQADTNDDDRLSLDEYLTAIEQRGSQQDQSQQDRQQLQQDQQDQQNQQQNQQESTQVDVEEQPANVDVQSEAADVNVEQEEPNVTVEQPEPDVQVEQAEPEVNVEQAEPNVTVEQQGEPEVNIEEGDEADVEVVRPEDEENQQQQDQQQQSQKQQNQQQQSGQSSEATSLMTMQVDDLEGMQVVNNNGQEIGDIEHVAQHTQDNKLYGIVTVGGFWGIGAEEIALPLEEMQLQDDQLVMQTDRGEDEIKNSAEQYNEDNYTQLESGQTLQEAAGSGN